MAIFTSAILGTLVGSVTSIVPGILSFFQRRDELKHAQAMASIKHKFATEAAKLEMDLVDIRAYAEEGKNLRDHDSSLDGEGFINALRASVRPIITYLFFLFFLLVKCVAVLSAIQTIDVSIETLEWTKNIEVWERIMPIIWDDFTAATFGAIMGFWFGGRSIEKLMFSRKQV